MDISKEAFTFLVKNGFEKNDSEIINAFVDTYNQHFKTTIYDVTACGDFGLQGFISEGQGLNITDMLHICEDYKANKERNTYFFFANCGNPCRLVAYLDEFINVMGFIPGPCIRVWGTVTITDVRDGSTLLLVDIDEIDGGSAPTTDRAFNDTFGELGERIAKLK